MEAETYIVAANAAACSNSFSKAGPKDGGEVELGIAIEPQVFFQPDKMQPRLD